MSVDFLRVDGAMIQKFGLEAAALYALVSWRAEKRQGSWVASFADITDDTGLTRRRIQVARAVLVEAGILTCERGEQSSLRWSTEPVIKPDVTCIKPDVAECTSYREDVRRQQPADAPLSALEQETVMPVEQPPATVTPIDGGLFPTDAVAHRDPTMDEWAQECRNIWRDQFTAATGHQPHPDTASKAFGHIKRACSRSVTQDHFRDVWRAARDAGSEGRWNVQVDKPLPASRPAQQNPLSVMVAESYANGDYDHLMPGRELNQ